MPSKGIICYAYTCVPGYSIEFTVPKVRVVKDQLGTFTVDHLEMESSNLPWSEWTGVFQCRVLKSGQEVWKKYVEISSWSGSMGSGDMKTLADQRTFVNDQVCITHCFYDAPAKDNVGGLPYQDQCYVTVSPNYSNWMGQVAKKGSAEAGKPFRRLVLPAAHDVGMNSMENSLFLIQKVPNAIIPVLSIALPPLAALSLPMAAIGALAPSIIQSAAITQKDSLNTMLTIGTRYFEFRPAYLHNSVRGMKIMEDRLYFMHGPIPGMDYGNFLRSCVEFLVSHPDEIIVCQLRWDGIPAECARPTESDLGSYLKNALQAANGSIKTANEQEMNSTSIDKLRSEGRRLILLQNADSFSTYGDNENATLDGSSILSQLQSVNSSKQAGKAFTNLQCQATSTNIKQVWFSALSATASNSWLLATKAICDNKTMPWIASNALGKLTADQMIVIMDDFVDGGMCDVAVNLSRKRLAA